MLDAPLFISVNGVELNLRRNLLLDEEDQPNTHPSEL